MDRIAEALENLSRSARRSNHRCALIIAGSAVWCRDCAPRLLAKWGCERVLWIGDTAPDGMTATPGARAASVLGQETDAVVLDAYCGFNLDAFGAVTGTLSGGGLCLLLTPPLQQWPAFADPDYGRVRVTGWERETIPGRFLHRLVRVIRDDENIFVISQEDPVAGLPAPEIRALAQEGAAGESFTDPICRTQDQRLAVEAIMRVARGHRHRPLVLVSDRGRGKSAALGIAAAEVLRDSGRHILVTAPRIDAAAMIFKHAQQLLDSAHAGGSVLCFGKGRLEFVAPDALLRIPRQAQLLLVDEAAALPTPILVNLLVRYPRIVFATTVHGYEGTGRGFAVRFYKELSKRCVSWRCLHLDQPIRWAANDPLERFVFRALLMDAVAPADNSVAAADSAALQIEKLDRDALIDDEKLLGEIFGLLVIAHYRTRPFDLRLMLDAPNLSLYVARYNRHVVATAMVVREGELDSELAFAVWAGYRRPQGHLLPESLAVHVGLRHAATMHCNRILRIAVHPQLQGRGIGTLLIRRILEDAGTSGCDYVGSSFGATEALVRFWRKSEFLPVRLSVKRDAASGEHSAMVLRALTDDGHRLIQQARERFGPLFLHQLSDPLKDLEADLVACLLSGVQIPEITMETADWENLIVFADGQRIYEVCMWSAWKLACRVLLAPQGLVPLPSAERDAVITRILQKRDWKDVACVLGLPGRRAIVDLLRQAVRRMVQQLAPEMARRDIAKLASLRPAGKTGRFG